MKKFVCSFFLSLISCFVFAQTLDDIGRICIRVAPFDSQEVSSDAAAVLSSRMHQFITSSGICENGIDRRFEMCAEVLTVSKDVLAGPPSRVSQKLEITLFIQDVVENKTFGSISLDAVGIGLNETKAYIMAFNSLKTGNSKVKNMIDSAKDMIVAYYRSSAEKIMQDARRLADLGNYDEAIYSLSLVPDVCGEESQRCQDLLYVLFRERIDSEGERLLSLARGAWAESPDANGANRAVAYLNDISVLAQCQNRVSDLLLEITKKIKEDQKKAWEFKLQQYANQKAREQRDFEFKVRQYEDEKERQAVLHQEELAREQRDFDFSVRQFEADNALKHAIVDSGKEVALAFAKKAR